MQIIEAALAFAITMLVLSLICSTLVELIHRFLKLRETGLKYMLEQVFDQVLAKYVAPNVNQLVTNDATIAAALKDAKVKELIEAARSSFVERMRANRTPGGVPIETKLDAGAPKVDEAPKARVGILGGRELSTLSPNEFMERLGSIDLGKIDIGDLIQKANGAANTAAKQAGTTAAGVYDAVLKDVAQKFEAFGKEASVYFEGRARLLSVLVALGLAFAINVDAIDLFSTFLRDPAVRAKVIEQMKTVQDQQKAAQDAWNAARTAPPAAPGSEEVKQLQERLKTALDNIEKTTTQFGDMGVPLGWDKAKLPLWPLPQLCVKSEPPKAERVIAGNQKCDPGETGELAVAALLKLLFSLTLGGILVGLGGPYWSKAVSALSGIRSLAGGILGGTQTQPQTPGTPLTRGGDVAPKETPQPTTPVDIFEAAKVARDAAKPPSPPATPVNPLLT